MTKYILAGGNDLGIKDFPERLNKEIQNTKNEFSVLSCFFSRPESDWNEQSKIHESWFAKNLKGMKQYSYATERNFKDKAKIADIIYLHGGDTVLLSEKIKKQGDLKEIFKDKIVIGSSAGANILSTDYWSSSRAEHHKGLGILDINIMVHFGAKNHEGRKRNQKDWQAEEREFRKIIGKDAEIIKLPEGEFKVFEV